MDDSRIPLYLIGPLHRTSRLFLPARHRVIPACSIRHPSPAAVSISTAIPKKPGSTDCGSMFFPRQTPPKQYWGSRSGALSRPSCTGETAYHLEPGQMPPMKRCDSHRKIQHAKPFPLSPNDQRIATYISRLGIDDPGIGYLGAAGRYGPVVAPQYFAVFQLPCGRESVRDAINHAGSRRYCPDRVPVWPEPDYRAIPRPQRRDKPVDVTAADNDQPILNGQQAGMGAFGSARPEKRHRRQAQGNSYRWRDRATRRCLACPRTENPIPGGDGLPPPNKSHFRPDSGQPAIPGDEYPVALDPDRAHLIVRRVLGMDRRRATGCCPKPKGPPP